MWMMAWDMTTSSLLYMIIYVVSMKDSHSLNWIFWEKEIMLYVIHGYIIPTVSLLCFSSMDHFFCSFHTHTDCKNGSQKDSSKNEHFEGGFSNNYCLSWHLFLDRITEFWLAPANHQQISGKKKIFWSSCTFFGLSILTLMISLEDLELVRIPRTNFFLWFSSSMSKISSRSMSTSFGNSV